MSDEELNELIDEEHLISGELVKSKSWDSMIIPDVFYYRESLWLYEYLDRQGSNEIELYHFEYGPNKVDKSVFIDDSIEQLVLEMRSNENKYSIITNKDRSFLIYKYQCEDYYIAFGDEVFIREVTKCTHRCEKIWFMDWVSGFSELGKNNMMTLWNKYKMSDPNAHKG